MSNVQVLSRMCTKSMVSETPELFTNGAAPASKLQFTWQPAKMTSGAPSHGVGNCVGLALNVSAYPTKTSKLGAATAVIGTATVPRTVARTIPASTVNRCHTGLRYLTLEITSHPT